MPQLDLNTPAELDPGVADALTDNARIRARLIDRTAYANDASHFLLTPSAVLVAADADEVAAILRAASASRSSITFRSGGTSLSGQGVTDGILVDVRQHFRRIEVLDDGRRVKVQPGATVRQVNARLAGTGFRLGPDPASETACTIGGVIANNSSGMTCGIEQNTYRTLESMVFVLPTGTRIDTAWSDANTTLQHAEPALVAGLLRLRDRVRSQPSSVEVIRRHFALKNTMGYGVNAFLDFDDPVEILAHLIIGSEGTLAFVAEATFRTVPDRRFTSTGLAIFHNLESAADALPALIGSRAEALEVMDATSLRVGRSLHGSPTGIHGFDLRDHAALLIEYRSDAPDELADLVARGSQAIAALPTISPVELSSDAVRHDAAWSFRKGLYASVAGARPSGTTALLEDIAVPVSALASTSVRLQHLLTQYGYDDGVIFGHARDGNLHFMLTDRFEGDAAIGRYLGFTDDLVELVLGVGGNLKAEHGTGRAMAPFVRRQYGDELYEVMRELKTLCDPSVVLGRGVILDDDAEAHIRHFKLTPTVEEEVDRCVECGYCEPVCPSRDLTLTPRQRIVVRRAMASAEARGETEERAELERDADYAAVQTCAVDGMCQTSCPVNINTGSLMKRLRRENAPAAVDAGWGIAASSWTSTTRAGALALTVADALPATLTTGLTDAARALIGADVVPRYDGGLPPGGTRRRAPHDILGAAGASIRGIYLPACVNSMFGPEKGGIGVRAAIARIAERSGVTLAVPRGIDGLCCGTPWSSKGLTSGYEIMTDRVLEAITMVSRSSPGLPILTDASSCTEDLHASSPIEVSWSRMRSRSRCVSSCRTST